MEKESEARPFVRAEVILIEHLRNFAVTIFNLRTIHLSCLHAERLKNHQ